MDKIRDGEWARWIAFSSFLLVVNALSQPEGFLSITCGGEVNTTHNGITWVGDAHYIDVGDTAEITDLSEKAYGSYLHTIRVFRKPLNKSCYQLPVVPDVPYLLRLWFALGNYSGFQQWPSFTFYIETLGLLASENVSFTDTDTDVYYYEYVFVSSGKVLHICFIRTSDTDDPFINAIELRTLKVGMYHAAAKPGTLLSLSRRRNVGGSTVIRYPGDNFDRIWKPPTPPANKNLVVAVTTTHPISSDNTDDFPPYAVLKTAWVVNSSESNGIIFNLRSTGGRKTLLLLYFVEIETLNKPESRSFSVKIDDVYRTPDIVSLVQNYSAVELTFQTNDISTSNFTFVLDKANSSTLAPIINAYEYYWVIDTQPPTYSKDAAVEALIAIKSKFGIINWISDPCYLIHWEGISCDNSSSDIRISELNLSGRDLKGSIPADIGQLTALINM